MAQKPAVSRLIIDRNIIFFYVFSRYFNDFLRAIHLEHTSVNVRYPVAPRSVKSYDRFSVPVLSNWILSLVPVSPGLVHTDGFRIFRAKDPAYPFHAVPDLVPFKLKLGFI